ncbi:MAG: transglycosylase SLT domain-containing protein [Thermodesulfobacteriota bacterium]
MKMPALAVSLLFILLIFSEAVCLADFYSYTDSNGKMHITNTPKTARYEMIMRETVERLPEGEGPWLDSIIKVKSEKYGVDPALVKALIKAESNFDTRAVSEAGASGLMQLMPGTAADMGVKDRTDPADNIDGGVRYLSRLLTQFGSDIRLALAAYNAGEKAVLQYGTIPPFRETRDYVQKVLSYYESYASR